MESFKTISRYLFLVFAEVSLTQNKTAAYRESQKEICCESLMFILQDRTGGRTNKGNHRQLDNALIYPEYIFS